jgi:hypothetical protein
MTSCAGGLPRHCTSSAIALPSGQARSNQPDTKRANPVSQQSQHTRTPTPTTASHTRDHAAVASPWDDGGGPPSESFGPKSKRDSPHPPPKRTTFVARFFCGERVERLQLVLVLRRRHRSHFEPTFPSQLRPTAVYRQQREPIATQAPQRSPPLNSSPQPSTVCIKCSWVSAARRSRLLISAQRAGVTVGGRRSPTRTIS